MTIHIAGTYGFASEAARAKAEKAFLEATSMPPPLARAEGPALSLTWDAPDLAYDSIRGALSALSEAASGGHVDLRAPGQGTYRCFAGDTPWGLRSEPTPEGASRRIGSIAFHFERGVDRVAFNARGELAVAGMLYGRGGVSVFDAAGSELLHAWAHERPDRYAGSETVAVAFSPGGERVVTGSCDDRAVVRDVRSGRPLAKLAHHGPVRDVAWVGETIVTVGDRTVIFWDQSSYEERASLSEADVRVIGQDAGAVLIYKGRRELARLDVASASIADVATVDRGVVAMAPDGRYAIAPEKMGKVAKAIAIHAGKKKVSVKLDAAPVGLAFAKDGSLIAALEDGALVVVTPGGAIAERYSISDKLWSGTRIAIAEDGRVAIAAGGARPVLVDRIQGAVVCAPDPVSSVIASPIDATFVLLGHRPRWVDPRTNTERALPHSARGAAFSADGAILAIYDGAQVRLLDAATLTARVERRAPSLQRLILSPDASALVTTSGDLALFDIASGKAKKLGKKGERFSAAAFSPDGRLVAAAEGMKIVLFDVATGKAGATLSTEPLEGQELAFSPDGQRLAVGSRKGLAVWDMTTKERLFLQEVGADALAWAPDGATIAAAGWGPVTIVNSRDGATRERFHGHLGSVYSVAFTGDGSQLVSVGAEGTALVVPRAASPLPRVAAAGPAEASKDLLAERVAVAERAQSQRASETSQAREAVRVAVRDTSSATLSIAFNEGFLPGPAIPRPAMRLRAHGTLLFPSKAALDEGVRNFDKNAYVEWYSASDLKVTDRTVTVAIDTDLEVDCVTFGSSFMELALRASGGAIDVAWDDQVTSMRFVAGCYSFAPRVPALPPAARVRYGRMASALEGHLVMDGRGGYAAQSRAGVVLMDARGAVTHEYPAAARGLVAMDEAGVIVLSLQSASDNHERLAIARIDRASGAALRAFDVSSRKSITRPGLGGHFVLYDDNDAQLCDLTPRLLGKVTLDKNVHIRDAAVDATGALVALASHEGLFLWDPSAENSKPARVEGAYTSVAFLESGHIVALGGPDPNAKNIFALLTLIRPSGEILETVKAGKDLARIRALGDGLVGSSDYEGVLASFGPDLKRRWIIDLPKRSGELEMVPSAGGRALLCVSSSGSLLGFDAATGELALDHSSPVVAMDATEELLATLDASGDLVVRGRRAGDLRFRHRIALKAEKNVHIVFVAQGLAVADSDRLVLINVGEGTVRDLEKNKLTCAAWSADGTLVTGHADGKVRLVSDVGTRVLEVGGDVRRITVAASSDRFACLFKDGAAAVFDGGSRKRLIKASKEFAGAFALSSDGRTLAFVRARKERHSMLGEVVLLDVDSGSERLVLSQSRPAVCLFTRDGARLFVADGRSIRVIDMASGSITGTIVGHSKEVRALALPLDGALLSASEDQTVVEWDLEAVAALGGGHPHEEMGIP